ncbi:hypothetical protein [Streptomyces sp. SBT349]|uniref:hypothetical protein n=1 Tax=Streptomyces sp. SBT349 TaxID=1580539 RepID=UPI00066CDF61|nr:hypothetical protein [Streptomyces sp. SBT349]
MGGRTGREGARRVMVNPDASTGGAWEPETRLYSEGAFRGTERPVLAPAGGGHRRIEGTPFLDPAGGGLPGAHEADEAEVRAFRRRLAGIAIPDDGGRYADLATTALLDLYALALPNGAVLGAASPYWAFVWARDNALVVAAFALLGQYEDAWAALRFIYGVQEPDGQWEARYLPDGSGEVPDDRGRQDDGIGYTLWATWLAARLSPDATREAALAELRPAVLAAVAAGGDVLDAATSLPRTSQDFWEMDQAEPSLGVAGPLAFGLRAGAELADQLGESALADRARGHADALLAAVVRTYRPSGYEHFPSGGGRDASVAFLLPPFIASSADPGADLVPGARAAWNRSRAEMRVANGGLRPGAGWPDPHTAWNPQVSLYAITAAALSERATARALLDWMDAHRTALGSLPEKVTAAGAPAAVAPISTVASAALIALALLDGRPMPVLRGYEPALAPFS